MCKKRNYEGLFAHTLIVAVLIAAPTAPVIVAKIMLLSTASCGSMLANIFVTVGDARNAKNPIANPTIPKIASAAVLDAILITIADDFPYPIS